MQLEQWTADHVRYGDVIDNPELELRPIDYIDEGKGKACTYKWITDHSFVTIDRLYYMSREIRGLARNTGH